MARLGSLSDGRMSVAVALAREAPDEAGRGLGQRVDVVERVHEVSVGGIFGRLDEAADVYLREMVGHASPLALGFLEKKVETLHQAEPLLPAVYSLITFLPPRSDTSTPTVTFRLLPGSAHPNLELPNVSGPA